MTINIFGVDWIPDAKDVAMAMGCHVNVINGRETWEENQEICGGAVATFLQTIVDLCLAGF